MPTKILKIVAISAGILCAALNTVAQDYPNKPVRIVTAEAGGGSDLVTRLIAQGLTSTFQQQVLVENRGGSAVIPAQIVAQASADGYTLLLSGNSVWLLPLLQETPYDPVRSFAPITLAVSSPNILVVHPSVQARSVEELIGLARAHPGALNYASGITGAANHLAAELFQLLAGVKIVRVAYKGAAPALNDLIGGQVQLMFASAGSVAAHVKSARLRALAITSAVPSALISGVPTIAASGLPGYEAISMFGLFGPARTPNALIDRINRETVKVLGRADIRDKLLSAGVEVVANAPLQFAAAIKSEMAIMGKVVKTAGLRTQ